MTVNETIFSLLKESMFGVKKGMENDYIKFEKGKQSEAFWNQVYVEAQAQAVAGIIAPVMANHSEIPDSIRYRWSAVQKPYAIRYTQMAAGQNETCKLLQQAGIPVVVMKGMAAAIYYPIPDYRTMGDVDLLVSPENYKSAVKLLEDNGYELKGEEESQYHTAFTRYKILYELHQSPAGVHRAEKGDAISEYILSGLEHIEINEIGQECFPILPWKQNGMELIWHIRQHLYNGLGLRHIVDWMMFVNYMLDDTRMAGYMHDLKKCGLDYLAIVVTKMCQKYLGLPKEKNTWCDGADEELCDELMEFIMGQGNFGVKALDEKTAKVLSGYSSPRIMLTKLQALGEANWKVLKKYPEMTPLAFIYGGFYAVRTLMKSNRGIKKMIKEFKLGNRRKRLFSRLYKRK